jgi:hypothetical protein
MDKALNKFHSIKDIFINLKLRQKSHFNFPKMHAMQHYTCSIQLLGSADGFNMEASEQLHIDYAKEAFKASNRRGYVGQMTSWLHCQESIECYSAYLKWLDIDGPIVAAGMLSVESPSSETSTLSTTHDSDSATQPPKKKRRKMRQRTPPLWQQGERHKYSIAQKPSSSGVPVAFIAADYAAPNFVADVRTYLKRTYPKLPDNKLPSKLDRFDLFPQISVYLPGRLETGNAEAVDRIACTAAQPRRPGARAKPAQFDVVLVAQTDGNLHTIGTSLEGT